MIRPSILLLALVTPSLPTRTAQEATTPRDLYVDAWFLETAEADLEGALKLYRECAERAASTDRELAAKALLRVARIAQARGDADAAALVRERIGREFAGTAAAAQAEANSPDELPVTASQRMEAEARRWLDEMLSAKESSEVTRNKAESVVRLLGIEEVLRVHRARGGALYWILTKVGKAVLGIADWRAVASRNELDPSVRKHAFSRLAEDHGILDLEALERATFATIPPDDLLAKEFVAQSLRVGTRDALAKLVRAASEAPSALLAALHDQTLRERLLASEHEEAGAVVAAFAAAESWGELIQNGYMTEFFASSTPAGRAVVAAFPRMKDMERAGVAYQLQSAKPVPLTEEAVKALYTDPEPRVRHAVITQELSSEDSMRRRRGAQALASMPPPLDSERLSWLIHHGKVPSLDELLDELEGANLVYLYTRLIESSSPRLSVIREGLDRSHAELPYALFLPWPILGGDVTSGGRVIRPSGAFAGRASDLRAELLAAGKEGPFSALVDQTLAIEDEALWLAAYEGLRQFAGEPFASNLVDRFAATGSWRLLLAIAKSRPAHHASIDTWRTMLTHPADDVRAAAIVACPDVALLLEIVATCPSIDLQWYFQRGAQAIAAQNSTSLVRDVMRRSDPESQLALHCFQSLFPPDVDSLILAFERGSREGALGQEAWKWVRSLLSGGSDSWYAGFVVPPSLRGELAAFPVAAAGQLQGSPKEVAATLMRHREPLEAALRAHRARKLLADRNALNDSDRVVEAIADLGGIELARELLANANESVRGSALRGLARLGANDEVLSYVRSQADPNEGVRALLDLGALDELRSLVAAGRVHAGVVLSAAVERDDGALAAEMFLRPENGLLEPAPNVSDFVIAHLVETRNVDALLVLARERQLAAAVRGLFALAAIERILVECPRWPEYAWRAAFEEFQRRTGLPAANVKLDFDLETVRREQVAAWREALAR
jgi:hypothetical protein